jgi:uncharacterized protein YggE
MEIPQESKKGLYKALLVFMIILSLYFGVKFLSEAKSYGMMGNLNTITLSGHGEVQAVPDIATINFSIESSEATQALASEKVNNKTKSVLDFMKSSGIAEKDIKTNNYSSYPKYSNPEVCPMYYNYNGGMMPPCRQGESKIVGYTVSQGVTVKIRKVDDASKVIDGINKIGVTNMYGPSFTIDDEDGLRMDARKKAIDDAKEKAHALAKDLGVRLGSISSFSESGGYPYPMMYGKAEMLSADSGNSTPAELPKGENTISADVTITFEIR